MYQILVILAIVVAILLILIVLIQESKGGGLASGFSSANALVGVRKTTDFIEKTTWTLAAALVIISVLTVYATPDESTSTSVVTNMKSAPAPQLLGQTQQAPAAAPAAPAAQTPAPQGK